jgi:hypothetical protein
VLNAEHGDIGFIDEEMAAYRIQPGGVWSMGLSPREWKGGGREQQLRRIARFESIINLVELVDQHLGGRHRGIIRAQIAGFAQECALLHRELGDQAAMRRSLWKALRAQPWRPVRPARELLASYLR